MGFCQIVCKLNNLDELNWIINWKQFEFLDRLLSNCCTFVCLNRVKTVNTIYFVVKIDVNLIWFQKNIILMGNVEWKFSLSSWALNTVTIISCAFCELKDHRGGPSAFPGDVTCGILQLQSRWRCWRHGGGQQRPWCGWSRMPMRDPSRRRWLSMYDGRRRQHPCDQPIPLAVCCPGHGAGGNCACQYTIGPRHRRGAIPGCCLGIGCRWAFGYFLFFLFRLLYSHNFNLSPYWGWTAG